MDSLLSPLKQYRQGGLEAVDSASRRPTSNPRTVSDEVIAAIVHPREQLTNDGLDAGPLTLQWHLSQAGPPVLTTSTNPARPPPPPRADHPATTQTTAQFLSPV